MKPRPTKTHVKDQDVDIDWGRFESLVPEDVHTIIGSSEGLAGSGKSHFWLTAPAPIAYFLFDPGGLKGLRNNPMFREKEIHAVNYCGDLNIGKLPAEDRVQVSIDVMERFKEDWDVAIKNARTLIIDKESHLWEMLRYAYDEVSSPDPKNFHELNLIVRGLIQDAEATGRNLGLVRGIKDTWGVTGISPSSGKKQMGFTGIYKAEGNKYVDELVQVVMRHRWDAERRVFVTTIGDKCRLGEAEALMGQEFDSMDFPMLGQMLYPDADPEEFV